MRWLQVRLASRAGAAIITYYVAGLANEVQPTWRSMFAHAHTPLFYAHTLKGVCTSAHPHG